MKNKLYIIVLTTALSMVTLATTNEITQKERPNMQSLINQIQPNQIWRHYKNKDYRIIAISCNTEDLTWYVVYEALYDNTVSKIWHRPLEMFLETVEIDGNMVPRFKKVE